MTGRKRIKAEYWSLVLAGAANLVMVGTGYASWYGITCAVAACGCAFSFGYIEGRYQEAKYWEGRP